jgi:hypothetical protein
LRRPVEITTQSGRGELDHELMSASWALGQT